MQKEAIISGDKIYRYGLWRIWDNSKQKCLFICLNPSTADAEIDDPTLRRCMGFANSWGYGGVIIGNLFAYRATNPNDLLEAQDPIGPDNDKWLDRLEKESSIIIVAWGNKGRLFERDREVSSRFDNLKCLEINNTGTPRHPLYVARDVKPIEYREL